LIIINTHKTPVRCVLLLLALQHGFPWKQHGTKWYEPAHLLMGSTYHVSALAGRQYCNWQHGVLPVGL
jgi:hypothetical protein